MNFQAVQNANGNSVVMFAIFTEVGGIQYTQNQKAKSVCKLKDDTGVEHKVHLYQGTGQLPGPAQVNQRSQFTLSTFSGTFQNQPYTGYSGFWNSSAQVNQAPQTAQQAPPPAPQSPNAPRPAPQGVTEQDRQVSIERQAAFKAACGYGAPTAMPPKEVIEIARAGHYFIQTGNNFYDLAKPDPSITNVNADGTPTGDDIPF